MFRGAGAGGGKLQTSLTREVANELATKTHKQVRTFESSSKMGQAMRVEQVPLAAPEAVPGHLRVSEHVDRFRGAVKEARPRPPAGFVGEVRVVPRSPTVWPVSQTHWNCE